MSLFSRTETLKNMFSWWGRAEQFTVNNIKTTCTLITGSQTVMHMGFMLTSVQVIWTLLAAIDQFSFTWMCHHNSIWFPVALIHAEHVQPFLIAIQNHVLARRQRIMAGSSLSSLLGSFPEAHQGRGFHMLTSISVEVEVCKKQTSM